MKKTNKRGFTIVELVIVIAVIAILATVLVPTFSGVIANATDAAIKADAKAIYTEYIAADNGANAEKDFVIKAEKNGTTKYFAVIDGAFPAAGSDAEPVPADVFGTGAAFATGDDYTTDNIKLVVFPS